MYVYMYVHSQFYNFRHIMYVYTLLVPMNQSVQQAMQIV